MNNTTRTLTFVVVVTLQACASKDKPCEEILEVKHQAQQCEQWRKIMTDNNYPQQAMTAKKRYEQECQDLRYYRDDYDTICKGNETPIGESKKKTKP